MRERDGTVLKAILREMGADELRAVVKEAFRELLGEYARTFGWWSLRTIALASVGAVIVFVLWANGYTKG
jgi:hypothetical protein